MDLVPEDGEEDIAWAVSELNKPGRTQKDILFELNDRLAVKDIDPISKSAFNRKSVKLAMLTNELNEARYLFAGLAPHLTAETVDDSTMVLGEFIKVLALKIVQSKGGEIDTKGAMELARAHLAVIQGQKISSERRTKLQAEFKAQAAEAMDKVVKARGISVEVATEMRRELFGQARDGA